MKKILSIIAAVVVAATSCDRTEPPVFEDSSAQRVQNLIDAAYATLTSAPEGWYFDYYPGYEQTAEIGGFWFWCKFDTDYNVTAMSDLAVTSDGVYTSAISRFELVRGLGAVLTFSDYNEVLDQFYVPGVGGDTQGLQGELQFILEEVTADKVTVIGAKTRKKMAFVRKSTTTTVEADFAKVINLVTRMQDCPWYTVEVKGAMTAEQVEAHPTSVAVAVERNERTFSITYSELRGKSQVDPAQDSIYVTFDQNLIMCPSMTQENFFPLYAPVDVMGNRITGFSFAMDGDVGVLTSDDANQTVIIRQTILPSRTIADVVGTYKLEAISGFNGKTTIENIRLTRKNDTSVTVSLPVSNGVYCEWTMTLNDKRNALVGETPQETKVYFNGPNGETWFANFWNSGSEGYPVTWWITETGKMTCLDQWGIYAPEYNYGSGAYWDYFMPGSTFTR